MISPNDIRSFILGLPPHKHFYRLKGLLDTVDEFGFLRFYEFKCNACQHIVAVERAGFRRVLLTSHR